MKIMSMNSARKKQAFAWGLGVLTFLALIVAPVAVSVTYGQGASTQSDICPPGRFCLPNPLKFNNIWDLLQGMSALAVRLGMVLAVLAFIYAGFMYVTAIGNPTKLTKAHNTLKFVAIGSIIIMSATLIIELVINTLQRIQGAGGAL